MKGRLLKVKYLYNIIAIELPLKRDLSVRGEVIDNVPLIRRQTRTGPPPPGVRWVTRGGVINR